MPLYTGLGPCELRDILTRAQADEAVSINDVVHQLCELVARQMKEIEALTVKLDAVGSDGPKRPRRGPRDSGGENLGPYPGFKW